MYRTLLVIFAIPFLLINLSCEQSVHYKKIIGSTMGTTYSVVLDSSGQELIKLHQKIEQELADINQLMSTYIPDSEINRFNKLTNSSCFKFSDKTWQVLVAAKEVYNNTNGAFDITLGPLISRWGFDAQEYQERVPTNEEINLLLSNIGTNKLIFDIKNKCISKTIPQIAINLSAIAKGYAVDRLAQILTVADVNHYLIDIGGEVKGFGLNNQRTNWRIAVEKPNSFNDNKSPSNQRQASLIVKLPNTSIATSGDYRNYFEIDGKRFSHTIDPNTGFPIQHSLTSISVIHSSNMLADAYATAFNVLGVEKSHRLAQKLKLAIYTIEKNGDEFTDRPNRLFKSYISD